MTVDVFVTRVLLRERICGQVFLRQASFMGECSVTSARLCLHRRIVFGLLFRCHCGKCFRR